ncbi:helix-turn-helix domain-containing protein [Streptococcus sp. zg-JUN1979]|uniref:helix-turn-helix domain-containing protein n=1 Tax=Streptococcus sp. zg-JUN1979 TaxID=3391450 RepID=UPI0039A459D6
MIGKTIQQFRKDLNIQSFELAKAINISSSLLSLIENEKRNPSIEQLQNIIYQLAVDKVRVDERFRESYDYREWLTRQDVAKLLDKEDEMSQKTLETKNVEYCVTYYLKELVTRCYERLDELTPKERQLYDKLSNISAKELISSLEKKEDVIDIKELLREARQNDKEIVLDLEDLGRRPLKLYLDGEEITSTQRQFLTTMVKGLKIERQERRERLESRERRERRHQSIRYRDGERSQRF